MALSFCFLSCEKNNSLERTTLEGTTWISCDYYGGDDTYNVNTLTFANTTFGLKTVGIIHNKEENITTKSGTYIYDYPIITLYYQDKQEAGMIEDNTITFGNYIFKRK